MLLLPDQARGLYVLAVRVALFFFFQAEDGIRDHCVTGVQTCALPISPASMEFEVEPYWFQRTSVRLAALCACSILIYLVIRLRGRQIQARNAELEDRVHVRTEQLAQARDEAEAAGRVKANFLAAMSHEIRTPMNGVIGMIEVLKQTPLTPDQFQMLSIVSESGETLITILNGIL